MNSGKDVEYLQRLFPEIDRIRDQKIKRKVMEIWIKLWKQSSWKKIEECPREPDDLKSSVVETIRCIIRLAIEIARALEKIRKVEINYDFLISAGLIQDAPKLLEFEKKKDGKIVTSEIGRKFPHGYYSAHAALEAALPVEIVNMIITHTIHSPITPSSIEGWVNHYAVLLEDHSYSRAK